MTRATTLRPRDDHPGEAVAGWPGGQVACALGGRRHLPLRPHEDARRGVLDRHPASDGERIAAHRARDVVLAHRPHGPLPADARQGGLLPDGVGRQRPQRGAPRPAGHRHDRRPDPPLRPGLPAAREGRPQGPSHPGQPAELHRPLRAGGPAVRSGVPRAVGHPRALGRLGPHLHLDRSQGRPHLAARVPAPRGPRPRLPERVAHAVGRRHAHVRRPGRARRPRDRRGVPQDGVHGTRRSPADRHDPARAPRRVRGRGRPP